MLQRFLLYIIQQKILQMNYGLHKNSSTTVFNIANNKCFLSSKLAY